MYTLKYFLCTHAAKKRLREKTEAVAGKPLIKKKKAEGLLCIFSSIALFTILCYCYRQNYTHWKSCSIYIYPVIRERTSSRSTCYPVFRKCRRASLVTIVLKCRTASIYWDSRTTFIYRESRTASVCWESRTASVYWESRTALVYRESRTASI